MIEVIPTGKALGAEIRGVDISRPLEPADVQSLLDAWTEHLVLLLFLQNSMVLSDLREVLYLSIKALRVIFHKVKLPISSTFAMQLEIVVDKANQKHH